MSLHSFQRQIIEIRGQFKVEEDAYRSIENNPGIFKPFSFRNLTKVSIRSEKSAWLAGRLSVQRQRRLLQREFRSSWAGCPSQYTLYILFSIHSNVKSQQITKKSASIYSNFMCNADEYLLKVTLNSRNFPCFSLFSWQRIDFRFCAHTDFSTDVEISQTLPSVIMSRPMVPVVVRIVPPMLLSQGEKENIWCQTQVKFSYIVLNERELSPVELAQTSIRTWVTARGKMGEEEDSGLCPGSIQQLLPSEANTSRWGHSAMKAQRRAVLLLPAVLDAAPWLRPALLEPRRNPWGAAALLQQSWLLEQSPRRGVITQNTAVSFTASQCRNRKIKSGCPSPSNLWMISEKWSLKPSGVLAVLYS